MQFNGINQMLLVSFMIQNVRIWPNHGQKMAYMPIFGHKFFDHYSVFFEATGLELFREAQETIIYRFVMGNSNNDVYAWFLGHFWRGNGRGHHALPWWSGPPNSIKKLPIWWTFWNNRHLEIMFSKFSWMDPPKRQITPRISLPKLCPDPEERQ